MIPAQIFVFFNLRHFCSLCGFSTVAVVEVHQHCDTPCCFPSMMYSLHILFLFLFPMAVLLFFQFRFFFTAVTWHAVKFCLKAHIHCADRSECFDYKLFRKKKIIFLCLCVCVFFVCFFQISVRLPRNIK